MNKNFSNIIIFSSQTIEDMNDKITKMLRDLGYVVTDKRGSYRYELDIVQDKLNKIFVINSPLFNFKNLSKNKSIIRKLSKKVNDDTMMVYSDSDISVIERYSFNKRLYDYIALGNKEKLNELDYKKIGAYFNENTWKNHFVGRNSITKLDEILNELNTYFENYEVILDILKLYGIKDYIATYNPSDDININGINKDEIYFK